MNSNLREIKKINVGLYNWIKKDSDISWMKIIKSENGQENFFVKQGSFLNLAYDIKDPGKEAEQAVEQMNLAKENVSIVIGFGLGYLTNAILKKKDEGHRLIVVEPDNCIVRLVLDRFDFSEFLKSGQLVIVRNTEDLNLILYALSEQVDDWIMTVDKYTNFVPEIYHEVILQTKNILNQVMCNVGTISGKAGSEIADNDIACLPYVIQYRGVKELKDLYLNKPAILVSTGPSLKKNIHNLIGKTDNFVLIAVGQALRVLLSYDIVPDFICSVDFGKVNMGHFDGLMNTNVPLVTINRTYAPLLKAWQGPKFIVNTPVPGFENSAASILSDKGTIEAGGSVSHLCFGLAKLLGCNPISFIGLDLAYENDDSHIKQVDAGGKIKIDENGLIKWKVKDQRCDLSNRKEVNMGYVQYVPGYFGDVVPTNSGLLSFLTTFESMIERHLKEK